MVVLSFSMFANIGQNFPLVELKYISSVFTQILNYFMIISEKLCHSIEMAVDYFIQCKNEINEKGKYLAKSTKPSREIINQEQ